MVKDQPYDLTRGYTRLTAKDSGLPWDVFVSRTGHAPVVLIHELPAITPQVAALGDAINRAGFRVYMPTLMGAPGAVPDLFEQTRSSLTVCVRKDIQALNCAEKTRGAVSDLRRLAGKASEDAGGAQVDVIGLCFTGGFAIATATEPQVAAAVASEPALPFDAGSHIDLSRDDELAIRRRIGSGALRAMLIRFQGDSHSPCSRVTRYGHATDGAIATRCVPDCAANPAWRGLIRRHSVLTNELVDQPGSLTLAVRDEVIAFLNWRLCKGPEPSAPPDVAQCLKSGCAAGTDGGPAPLAPHHKDACPPAKPLR